MSLHVLRIVEACYAVELPEAEWLSGLCEAARPLLDDGFGLNASTFDLSELGTGHLLLATLGMPEALVSATHRLRMSREQMRRMFADGSRIVSLVARADQDLLAGDAWRELREVHGSADMLAIIGGDSGGTGVALSAHRRSVVNLSSRERDQWERIAEHAATAFRLRRRLAASAAMREPVRARVDGVDVMLAPNGHIAVTEPSAMASDLRASALAVDSASSVAAEHATAHWSALIEGRWSLVDQFENGGRRFLIAHRGGKPGRAAGLTAREHAVLAYRARGCSLKLIAAELGRTVSAVARDIERGMSKLGLRGQAELAQLFARGRA